MKLIICTTRDGKPWSARADMPDNVIPSNAALQAWARDVVNLIRNVGRQENGKFMAEMLGNVAVATLLVADDLEDGIQKNAQLQVARYVEQYAPPPKPATAAAETPQAPAQTVEPAKAPEAAETADDAPTDAETDDNPAPA